MSAPKRATAAPAMAAPTINPSFALLLLFLHAGKGSPQRLALFANEEEENDCSPIADRFDKLDGMGPLRLFEDKSRVVSLGRRPI